MKNDIKNIKINVVHKTAKGVVIPDISQITVPPNHLIYDFLRGVISENLKIRKGA